MCNSNIQRAATHVAAFHEAHIGDTADVPPMVCRCPLLRGEGLCKSDRGAQLRVLFCNNKGECTYTGFRAYKSPWELRLGSCQHGARSRAWR